jgi:hypothetical protein
MKSALWSILSAGGPRALFVTMTTLRSYLIFRQTQDVSATEAALRLRNNAKFGSLAKAFLFHDKDHNGTLDKEELRQVCFELNVPISADMIDSIFATVDVSGKGKIDYATFSKYFDWRAQDAERLFCLCFDSYPHLPQSCLLRAT